MAIQILEVALYETVIAFISFILFIVSLTVPADRTRDLVPGLLAVTWFLSAITAIIRYYAKVAIEQRCTWRRSKDEAPPEQHQQQQQQQPMEEESHNARYRRHSINASVALFRDGKGLDMEDLENETSTAITNDDTHNGDDGLAGSNNYGTSRAKTRLWSVIVRDFLRPSKASLYLLHGPALALLLTLTARLLAVRNFRTEPIDLNFGPSPDHTHDGLICYSFVGGSSSFFAALCGFLSSFLSFPAVSGTIARSIANLCPSTNTTTTTTTEKKNDVGPTPRITCARALMALTTYMFSSFTYYPTHNLLLKLINGDASFLSSTSYPHQCMEWMTGYLIGTIEGMLVSAIALRLLAVDLPNKHHGGLVPYMQTFEITIREELTRKELEHEWQLELEKRRLKNAEKKENNKVYVREVWDDHQENREEEHDDDPSQGIQVPTTKSEKKYAFGKLEEYTMTRPTASTSCATVLYNIYHVDILTVTNVLSTIPLVLFTASVLVGGVCMGWSWNECVADQDECINSPEDGVDLIRTLTYVFPISFGMIELGLWYVVRQQQS